jgi:putative redox protein
METKAEVRWLGDSKLEGMTDPGKIVYMDSGENALSASPAQLLLQALAGCTMLDCILIFKKARKHLEKFWVQVQAEEAQGYPKVYNKIHLIYNFVGDLTPAEIERAIKLSQEKYCRVSAMLKPCVSISYAYKKHENFNEFKIKNNNNLKEGKIEKIN